MKEQTKSDSHGFSSVVLFLRHHSVPQESYLQLCSPNWDFEITES